MRKIDKNPPPNSFLEYTKKTNPEDPNYKPTYDGLDTNEKERLQLSLLNEQGWVCGYCMQNINQKNMKIEHHCEQTICNGENGTIDRTLDYTNMLAVCMGVAGRKEIYCDSKKSQFDILTGLPMVLSPMKTPHMAAITYSSTGLIESGITRHENELNKFLSLNTKHLKDLRERKFRKIYAASKHTKPAVEIAKMKKILENDLQMSAGNKFSNSFPGLSEYMLKTFCK